MTSHWPPPLTRRLALGAGLATLVTTVGAANARAARRAHAPAILRRPKPPAPMVVLDAGHGGKDPGAIGYAGTYEKHIAIAAANELHASLNRAGHVRCTLTRDDDVFIPLEDRVAIAQGRQAGLFVSMHADAIASRSVRGASVYTLSDVASDAQTAALARRENSADRFAGPHFHATSPEVEQILASLVRQETRAGSAHMARSVVASLRPSIGLLDNPSRQAAFVVLKAPDIPSVLVEMGFMSNPADETLLRQPAHRARITLAMQRAIEGFFTSAGSFTRMTG